MSDFETNPVGTAKRLAEAEARLAGRWLPFGSHVGVMTPDGLEFDGEGEDGLPMWERVRRAMAGYGLTDDDLPGMWTHSDFEGGDPDSRSYAQRERDGACKGLEYGKLDCKRRFRPDQRHLWCSACEARAKALGES